jgi:F0F1-type ATP synthase delta subunit
VKPKLPPSIQTPQQLANCLEELKHYQKAAQSKQLAQRIVKDTQAVEVLLSPASLALLDANNSGKQLTIEKLEEIIQALREFNKQAPVIHLTIATSLSQKGQQELAEWFREVSDPASLLAFTINPTIAGGIIVRTPNRVHDFSYAGAILKKRQDLIKAVRNV